ARAAEPFIDKAVKNAKEKYGVEVPKPLIRAMMYRESRYGSDKIGDKRNKDGSPRPPSEWAYGLMQVQGTNFPQGVNPLDIEKNIQQAVDYLAQQIKTFGSIEKAVEAY